jgi:hypothetical protein
MRNFEEKKEKEENRLKNEYKKIELEKKKIQAEIRLALKSKKQENF